MPSSAAMWRNTTANLFVPADPSTVLSGTTTMANSTPGNYGVAIAASQTVKMQLPLLNVGVEKTEKLPPYEQYNLPKLKSLNQAAFTLYYQVAGAALTSMTLGIYATAWAASAPSGVATNVAGLVTTVVAQAQGPLQLAIGNYAIAISLKGLSVPVPMDLLVAELDIVTPVNSSAVISGWRVS